MSYSKFPRDKLANRKRQVQLSILNAVLRNLSNQSLTNKQTIYRK